MRLIFIFLLASMPMVRGGQSVAGRWEGSIKIPEHEQKLVVDLAQDKSGGWSGSITMPGLDVKGAALTDITLKDSELSFAIKSALGAQRSGPVTFKARLKSDDMLSGDFTMGGNVAAFTLTKAGDAQVELPPRSTEIAKELEGEWKGDFPLFDYTVHATLKLTDHPEGATAEFIVIGKRTTNLPVDLVTQEGELLTIDSHETGMSYEGRWQKKSGEIKGIFFRGPVEIPLVLTRTK